MKDLLAKKVMILPLKTSRKSLNISPTPLIKFKSNGDASKKVKSRFIAANEFNAMTKTVTTLHFFFNIV